MGPDTIAAGAYGWADDEIEVITMGRGNERTPLLILPPQVMTDVEFTAWVTSAGAFRRGVDINARASVCSSRLEILDVLKSECIYLPSLC